MDRHEALDYFLRRKSMHLSDKCQEAENIAIDAIMDSLGSEAGGKMPSEHLISRDALIKDLCEDRPEGTFDFTKTQAEAADRILRYVAQRIDAQPAVKVFKGFAEFDDDGLETFDFPGACCLVPWEVIAGSCGSGWEERWYIPLDGDPAETIFTRCAWVDGHVLCEDGSTNNLDIYERHYGKCGGCRIWGGPFKPTEQQRKETPWAE